MSQTCLRICFYNYLLVFSFFCSQPNVRCLVGLYGSLKDSSFENLNRLVEEDRDEQEILRYAISHEESDEVRFLVGSQSLKPQGSQVSFTSL